MTNNDKINLIMETVSNDAISAAKYIDENRLCSAEWIYALARKETLLNMVGKIELIVREV